MGLSLSTHDQISTAVDLFYILASNFGDINNGDLSSVEPYYNNSNAIVQEILDNNTEILNISEFMLRLFRISLWVLSNDIQSLENLFANRVNSLDQNITNQFNQSLIDTVDPDADLVNFVNWNVSNVRNFDNVFNGADMNIIGIQNWNVGGDGSFDFTCRFMLKDTRLDANLDLSSWRMTRCTNFEGMFSDLSDFKGVGLKSWDVSSALNMDEMFNNSPAMIENLQSWKPKSLTQTITSFVHSDYPFEKINYFIPNGNSYDVTVAWFFAAITIINSVALLDSTKTTLVDSLSSKYIT